MRCIYLYHIGVFSVSKPLPPETQEELIRRLKAENKSLRIKVGLMEVGFKPKRKLDADRENIILRRKLRAIEKLLSGWDKRK